MYEKFGRDFETDLRIPKGKVIKCANVLFSWDLNYGIDFIDESKTLSSLGSLKKSIQG